MTRQPVQRSPSPAEGSSRLGLSGLVREPLVHFLLMTAALFGVGTLFGSGDDVIEVSRAELDWRIMQVEAQEGPLSEEERRLVEEAYIDERVLVREARALGLEADERIDDILVQKMLHVLSGDVIQPADEELAAYYEANRERYAQDASVTVDELVLPVGGPFPRQIREGVPPEELPEDVRVSYRLMTDLTRDDLAALFGEDAARTTLAMESGAWVQATITPRGEHWLRVRERVGSVVPPLEVVRDVVRADWIAEREQMRLLERVAELRSYYTIEVEGR
jgi:hypothetical protein